MYLDVETVEHFVDNNKGQFITIVAEKKDGSLRYFNFKVCDKSHTLKNFPQYVTVEESNGKVRNFDKFKVLYLAAQKQVHIVKGFSLDMVADIRHNKKAG